MAHADVSSLVAFGRTLGNAGSNFVALEDLVFPEELLLRPLADFRCPRMHGVPARAHGFVVPALLLQELLGTSENFGKSHFAVQVPCVPRTDCGNDVRLEVDAGSHGGIRFPLPAAGLLLARIRLRFRLQTLDCGLCLNKRKKEARGIPETSECRARHNRSKECPDLSASEEAQGP